MTETVGDSLPLMTMWWPSGAELTPCGLVEIGM